MVKGERSGYRQDPVISVGTGKTQSYKQHIDITLTAKGESMGKTQSYKWAGKTQHIGMTLMAKERGYQHTPISGWAVKAQTPVPSRIPTRSSRSMGIGQGNLLHRKEITSNSRMQGVSIEQPCCHSLSKWRERTALQHRHAGMSTGSELCTLRGIPSKGAWALMARLSPSPWGRTHGTAPHQTCSAFSVHIHHRDESYQEDKPGQWPQCYIECSINQYKAYSEFYWKGSGPECSVEKRTNPSDRGMPLTLHWDTISTFCDTYI